MNWLKITLASALAVGAIATVTLANEPTASAQDDYVEGAGPPPEVVATVTPVYYSGRPHYYWGGRHYYRYGTAWRYYRSEPRFFVDYRARNPHYYTYHHYYRR